MHLIYVTNMAMGTNWCSTQSTENIYWMKPRQKRMSKYLTVFYSEIYWHVRENFEIWCVCPTASAKMKSRREWSSRVKNIKCWCNSNSTAGHTKVSRAPGTMNPFLAGKYFTNNLFIIFQDTEFLANQMNSKIKLNSMEEQLSIKMNPCD